MNQDLSGFANAINLSGLLDDVTKRRGELAECAVQEQKKLSDAYSRRHQLIVIGNGFDLACGLNSRYSAFFSGRLEIIDKITDYDRVGWCLKVRGTDLTIWDFMLRMRSDSNWFNVEEAMGRWILPISEDDSDESYVERALSRMKESPFAGDDFFRIICNGRLENEQDDEDYLIGNVARFIWMSRGEEAAKSMDKAGFFSVLRSELAELERLFVGFLSYQVEHSIGYGRNAHTLFLQLREDGIPQNELDEYDVTVLSFNYTRPFKGLGYAIKEKDVVNIHGNLDGEIIFGVDGTKSMGDIRAIPFTKTYRVASMGTKVSPDILHTESGGNPRFATDVIKFFGHSLGEADYSYFQAIFDGVNLYSGKTRLIFYTSVRPRLTCQPVPAGQGRGQAKAFGAV